jgi:hypothetical protein
MFLMRCETAERFEVSRTAHATLMAVAVVGSSKTLWEANRPWRSALPR